MTMYSFYRSFCMYWYRLQINLDYKKLQEYVSHDKLPQLLVSCQKEFHLECHPQHYCLAAEEVANFDSLLEGLQQENYICYLSATMLTLQIPNILWK
jgi:hypothetical protein